MANNVTKYSLIDYFDVWGNEEDGWEVNNQCVKYDDIMITDDATDQEILDYLKKIKFLGISDQSIVHLVEYGEGMIEIEEVADGRPVGRLQAVS